MCLATEHSETFKSEKFCSKSGKWLFAEDIHSSMLVSSYVRISDQQRYRLQIEFGRKGS